MKSVIFSTCGKIDCIGQPSAPVVICLVLDSLLVSGRKSLDGVLLGSSKSCDEGCGCTSFWHYTIGYDETLLVDPDTPLTNYDLSGIFCQDCETTWVTEEIAESVDDTHSSFSDVDAYSAVGTINSGATFTDTATLTFTPVTDRQNTQARTALVTLDAQFDLRTLNAGAAITIEYLKQVDGGGFTVVHTQNFVSGFVNERRNVGLGVYQEVLTLPAGDTVVVDYKVTYSVTVNGFNHAGGFRRLTGVELW